MTKEPKKTVLIVEDKPHWAALLTEILSDAGYDVVGVAPDGITAFGMLADKNPDLVTMDGSLLNGEEGLDIAAAIRKVNQLVPILMVSGNETEFEGRPGISKGGLGSGEDLLKAASEALKT